MNADKNKEFYRRVLMENYIVRIYRRDEKDRTKVTGVVESVERETRHTFHTLNSLRSVLMQGSDCNSTNPGSG